MPIPPPKRENANKVISAMMQRLQVSREDIMAFLEVGKYVDLAEPPEPPKPPKDGRGRR